MKLRTSGAKLILVLFLAHHISAPTLNIGEYYTDDIPGLAFFTSAKDSLIMRITWFDDKKKGYSGYKDFFGSKPTFGPSAPDDSYHEVAWKVDDNTVSFEWSRTKRGALARIKSTGTVKVIAWFAKAWPGSHPTISIDRWGDGLTFGNTTLDLRTNGALKKPLVDDGKPVWGEQVPITHASYTISPGRPALFSIQAHGERDNLESVNPLLNQKAASYARSRTNASGDWGNFLAPIQNEMGHSRVFSCDTGRISEIVSRGWCLPDGQVLFCWDSFFNGVLASIENPEAGRQVVRAILNAQQPNGLVPNFAGRGWGVSKDRSQPPVASMCIWKMYQIDPDKAFLREVYPKLMKWHHWWFTARDGNHDGLLEWGSETGVLQNAKFESGLDDSPMFDTGSMVGPHMTLDSTDLNSLWAMDCEYLAKIADLIGRHSDAQQLRSQEAAIASKINQLLWNPSAGNYCYRYWTPRQPRKTISLAGDVTSDNGPGFSGEYYTGRNFDQLVGTRQDAEVNFNWGDSPYPGVGHNNFSVRWSGNWTPKESASYIFKTYADDGVRLWIDGKQLVDDWKIHGVNETDTAPIAFEAGSSHSIKVEYFQAEGGASCRLEAEEIESGPGETFYNRFSPLNFYPMIAGVPNHGQAGQMLHMLFGPKFEAQYMCSTISHDDPAFPLQGYWRGTIWGPTNFLLFQGLKRYASTPELNEYSAKSVALFMKNWNTDGTCHENFSGLTGVGGGDAHYTWGALLCLIGLENLCSIQPDGMLRLNGASGAHIRISNFRLGGRLYDLKVEPSSAELSYRGRVAYRAEGKAREWAFYGR